MSRQQPVERRVVWVGPFPVPENGISEYFDKITGPMHGRVRVQSERVHFSNWQRDYPQQMVRAIAGLLAAAMERPKPLVHLQYCPFSTGPGSLVIAGLAKLLGMKLITTIHEDKSSAQATRKRLYWRVYPYVEELVFRLTDSFIVHSRIQMEKFPMRLRRKMQIIEFGVDSCRSELAAVAAAVGPTVGCFGLIAPHKGIETVIDACAIAAKSVPDLNLIIAGAVPATRRLEQYASRLREYARDRLGDSAEFWTSVSDEEFDGFYHRAAVVCFGLKHVNQSTTFYRAVGHAKPVIVTPVGGVAEIVAREHLGDIVPVDDPERMAEALQTLLTDEDAYEARRSAAAAYAARRPWDVNSDEHVDFYSSFLKQAA